MRTATRSRLERTADSVTGGTQCVNECCFDRSKRRWGRAKHRGSYGNAGDERMEIG